MFEGEDISKKNDDLPEGTVVETKIETDEDGSWKYTMIFFLQRRIVLLWE